MLIVSGAISAMALLKLRKKQSPIACTSFLLLIGLISYRDKKAVLNELQYALNNQLCVSKNHYKFIYCPLYWHTITVFN